MDTRIMNGTISGQRPVLFCFNHAGGSTFSYMKWCASLDVDFVPMEMPGRGIRVREPLSTDFQALCSHFAEQIDITLRTGPEPPAFALFGHSLGSAVAFRVAYILVERYRRRPACLLVAGRHAPMDEDPSAFRTSMGMDALEEVLRELKQTPRELLDNEEFRSFILPIVFNDYALGEHYTYEGELLDIPVLAYCGEGDVEANAGIMSRWARITTGAFRVRSFPGEHFFLLDEALRFADVLVEDLLALIGRGGRQTLPSARPALVPEPAAEIVYERGSI